MFIAVEVDDSVSGDVELAGKLEEACPVDIYAAGPDGVQLVHENLDECVLCGLCLDASPPGTVQGDQALRRRSAPGAGGLTNPAITPELFRRGIVGSFPGNLGIEVVRIEDEEVEGRLVVDERHLHPGGYVHGGVWVAFADTVAAWGTFRQLEDGQDFTTAELKANVFAAGRTGDVLTAIGHPLHVGRRTQVWEVRIKKDDRNAAFFTCTQMVLTRD